jgi:hypothetical protein
MIAAKEGDADLDGAVASSVGWDKLAASVADAERLARPDKVDLPALATRAWPVLHRIGPVFLDAFQLRAVPAAAATLRAVELLHEAYGSGGRKWPKSLPTSFLRPAWRDAVRDSGSEPSVEHRRTWEAATLLALRDRLRAGDIWVEGSRQWRAIEDQLIPPALFAAMKEAGPLPVAVPATAEEYLAERRPLLERRMGEINAKAAADALEDVRIKGGELKITPLKAITPEEAEDAAERLYAMVPNARITGVLADVHRWTGFANAFTHLHTGMPADDPRVVLTAVLADATNLGLTRIIARRRIATGALASSGAPPVGVKMQHATPRTGLASVCSRITSLNLPTVALRSIPPMVWPSAALATAGRPPWPALTVSAARRRHRASRPPDRQIGPWRPRGGRFPLALGAPIRMGVTRRFFPRR